MKGTATLLFILLIFILLKGSNRYTQTYIYKWTIQNCAGLSACFLCPWKMERPLGKFCGKEMESFLVKEWALNDFGDEYKGHKIRLRLTFDLHYDDYENPKPLFNLHYNTFKPWTWFIEIFLFFSYTSIGFKWG